MTSEQTSELTAHLQRLATESRARLLAVEALREQHRLVAEHSRRRLEASRLLLARARPATTDPPGPVVPSQPGAQVPQG